MIRVLIADDHELVRQGLRLVLDSADDVEVAAEAADGRQALERISVDGVDVAILDLQMPEVDGLSAIELIKKEHPGVHIIVLTIHQEEEVVRRAMTTGADGYLLKEISKDELIDAVRRVAKGQKIIDPKVTRALLDDLHKGDEARLSKREKQILQLMANGMSNKEMSLELGVSPETVKTHIHHILTKLEAAGRAHAVAIGLRERLVE